MEAGMGGGEGGGGGGRLGDRDDHAADNDSRFSATLRCPRRARVQREAPTTEEDDLYFLGSRLCKAEEPQFLSLQASSKAVRDVVSGKDGNACNTTGQTWACPHCQEGLKKARHFLNAVIEEANDANLQFLDHPLAWQRCPFACDTGNVGHVSADCLPMSARSCKHGDVSEIQHAMPEIAFENKQGTPLEEHQPFGSEWERERERERERQARAEQSYDLLRRRRQYHPLRPSIEGVLTKAGMAAIIAKNASSGAPLAIKARGSKKSTKGPKSKGLREFGRFPVRYACSDGGAKQSQTKLHAFLEGCVDFERQELRTPPGAAEQSEPADAVGIGADHRLLQLENQRLREELLHLKSTLMVKNKSEGGAEGGAGEPADRMPASDSLLAELSIDVGRSEPCSRPGGGPWLSRPQSALSSSSQQRMGWMQASSSSMPQRPRSAEPLGRNKTRRARGAKRRSPSRITSRAASPSGTCRLSQGCSSAASGAASPLGSVRSTSRRTVRALTPFEVDGMRIAKSQTRHLEWYGVAANEPIPMSERSRRLAREQGGRPASRERILHGAPSPAGRRRLERSFEKFDDMMAERYFAYSMPESSRRLIESNGLLQTLRQQPAVDRLSSPTSQQLSRRYRLRESVMEERRHQRAPPVWFRRNDTEAGLHPASLSARLAEQHEGTAASARHRILYDVPVGRSARWRRRRDEQAAVFAEGVPTKTFMTETSKALEKSMEEQTGQTASRRIILGESTATAQARSQRNMSLWRVDLK